MPYSTIATNGWDHPPNAFVPSTSSLVDNDTKNPSSSSKNSTSSKEWDTKDCHWKTAQRLFSLTPNQSSASDFNDEFENSSNSNGSLCAPIIIHNKYILVANGTSIALYGNFDDDDDNDGSIAAAAAAATTPTTTTSPLTECNYTADVDGRCVGGPSILSTCPLQLIFHEETNIIYLLTVESCIVQMKLVIRKDVNSEAKRPIDNDVNLNPNLSKYSFKLMTYVMTKTFGITCMNSIQNGGGQGIDTIFVGYKSGCIEAWNINSTYSANQKDNGARRNQNRYQIQWKGFMDCSVRTLSSLFRGKEEIGRNAEDIVIDHGKNNNNNNNNGNNTRINNDVVNSNLEKAESYFLIAVLATNTVKIVDEGQQHNFSTVKILDLKRIMNDARKIDYNPSDMLLLKRYSFSPIRRMESIDSKTLFQSHGADAACVLNNSCVVISFPNGCTSFITCKRSCIDATDMVLEENEQLLLSYPSIGNGQVDITDNDGTVSQYVATCLRGGTCYLIPTSTNRSKRIQSLITIPFPHDIETDLSDIYIQAFTAGNITLNRRVLPILIYAWPRGIVDVYVCDLFHPKNSNGDDSSMVNNGSYNDGSLVPREERKVLQELIDNGSLLILSNVLNELRADSRHPLLKKVEWQKLLREVSEMSQSSLPIKVDKIDFDSICSPKYESLRRVLLSLACENNFV